MADKETPKPHEPPKPVHIGGESLVDRILPHVKKILIGIVLLAVVLSVIFTLRWVKERKQATETNKLAVVLDVARQPVREAAALNVVAPPGVKEPGFATQAERAAAVLDAITKQGTSAGGHAFKGSLLFDANKLDESLSEYRLGQAELGLEGVLCREGSGLALEAKATAEKDATARQKLLEESLAAFAAMQPEEAGPRRAYALYHQARIQLALGKRTEAKANFEKAKELGGPTSDLSELIDRRLSAIGS